MSKQWEDTKVEVSSALANNRDKKIIARRSSNMMK